MKIEELKPEFVEFMPHESELKEGVIYISKKYGAVAHLCPCGCGSKIRTPININGKTGWWDFIENDGKVSLSPSVGNFQIPCKSHYFIKDNKVIWC